MTIEDTAYALMDEALKEPKTAAKLEAGLEKLSVLYDTAGKDQPLVAGCIGSLAATLLIVERQDDHA